MHLLTGTETNRSGSMLHEAQKRGATIFEAFSVSPPYWMTVSGCTSGSKVVHEDNLRPEMYGRFVNYLVRVVEHFRDVEGIKFESLEPFNEPDGDWWMAGGRQEGYAASYAAQNAIILALAHKLKREGLGTFVSGVDVNNIDNGLAGARKLDRDAISALGRLNLHDYRANNSSLTNSHSLKLMQYRALARRLHKPVWMSELGCCFKDQGDGTDMWGALFMADAVRADLRDLGVRGLDRLAAGLEYHRVRSRRRRAPTKEAILCACSIYALHPARLSDTFHGRRLQHACRLLPRLKTLGAGQYELGRGDDQRFRPRCLRRASAVGHDLSNNG